ncbi:MAG: hypothetical protein VYE32_04675 [Candidatus Thermoplasmatota archaeon]|nr:hypothetical protein [Candidatus Thermoplasmatota archaeon]|tara:strand:- start:985 stop:1197 length:213 start_codon:yes stop_codon:yes gene_type:complete
MEQSNPNAEILSVVDTLKDGKRADALDAISDLLYGRAAEAIKSYKQVVAKTFFDEPQVEEPSNETDNGTD